MPKSFLATIRSSLVDNPLKAPLFAIAPALLALVLNAAIPLTVFQLLNQAYSDTLHSRETIQTIDAVMMSMLDAETGERGYTITGNADFLEPYHSGEARVDSELLQLEELLGEDSAKLESLYALKAKITHALELFRTVVTKRQSIDFDDAAKVIASGEGKRRMDAVRAAAGKLRAMELKELTVLAAKEKKTVLYADITLILLTAFDLVLFLIAFVLLFKSIKSIKEARDELEELNRQTLKHSELLAQNNKTKDIQARLVDVLQAMSEPEEAYSAISRYCQHLFPKNPGGLYIRNHSRDYFELKANWGTNIHVDGYEPKECWASRVNHIYRFDADEHDIPCSHILSAPAAITHSICVPLTSSDDLIGTITLLGELNPDGTQLPIDKEVENLAHAVVSQIGLAIANLRLRASLRNSSIIDALTGLYNRRYIDETLAREIARAQRLGQSIGLIMLDVDHFKSFNDNYGHEAGDLVLRNVGALLKSYCRSSDMACRFGGEEFMIVLPQADIQSTAEKAELIRREFKKLNLMYGGQTLPAISVSLGVALYPIHGASAEMVIKAADDALYAAKHSGRDKVIVSAEENI